MGTRSVTTIYDEQQNPICAIYHQCDGYFEGVGLRIARFLLDMAIINGMSGDDGRAANGMGCLAAQLIAHLKSHSPGMGSVYMTHIGDTQEVNYQIRFPSGENYYGWMNPKPRWDPIIIGRHGEDKFSGTADQWVKRCAK